MTDAAAPHDDLPRTSLHVRGARAGRRESIDWIVERFTPLLLAQARYRLGRRLAALHEPEELVNDVWAVALVRLPEIGAAAERATPAFLAFLSKTLLQRANDLARRAARRGEGRLLEDDEGDPAQLADETRGALTRAAEGEALGRLREAIEELEPRDREVLVLRGIEQLDNALVAELTGQTPNAVSLRYNRTLERLRQRLPGSVFDELDP